MQGLRCQLTNISDEKEVMKNIKRELGNRKAQKRHTGVNT